MDESSSVPTETRYENAIVVKLEDTKQGLGIKIVGGHNQDNPEGDSGIYIKDIVPGYLAHKNGKLKIGDQILKANEYNLIGVSNEKAVDILRTCASTNSIRLIVARDRTAETEYRKILPTEESTVESSKGVAANANEEMTATSSNTSISSISYTSDSSTLEQNKQVQDNMAHSGRPISAISTASGPPPPLPTSPPPDEVPLTTNTHTISIPIEHHPTTTTTTFNANDTTTSPTKYHPSTKYSPAQIALSNAGNLVAARRKQHSDMIQNDDKALTPVPEGSLPIKTTHWITESVTPSTGTPTRVAYYTLPSDAPDIYFKSSGSNPKLADKKLTHDDVSKLVQTNSGAASVVKQRSKQEGVSPYQHKRLSVNPSNRFKFEKLIMALKYIGYEVTPQQKEELCSNLDIDEHGKVIYDEFVKLAQKMFTIKLDELKLAQALQDHQKLLSRTTKPLPVISDISHAPPETIHPPNDHNYILPSPPSPRLKPVKGSVQHIPPQPVQATPLQPVQATPHSSSITSSPKLSPKQSKIIPSVNATAALNEVKELENLLKQKEREISDKNRDNSKLKTELASLKELRDHERSEIASEAMSQKLAVMDCELRKKTAAIQRYQVATEQLCQFVEKCHNVLANSANQLVFHPQGKGEYVSRGNPAEGNPRPPVYLAKHAKKTGPGLAQEAKETLTTVRRILNTEELPDGWEEQYNKEGEKYYINHGDKSTTWTRPLITEQDTAQTNN